jgi:PAS domain S-box-containing protein
MAANPAMLRLLAVDSEAAVKGRNFADFYANPDERASLIEEWQGSGIDVREGEVSLRRADGEVINVLYAGRLVKDRHGRVQYRQGAFTDISALRREEAKRRKLEAHLRLSQKLESVGRLAAGIAHEINTPLQYVGDNVYFLRNAFDGLEKYSGAARAAVAAALERNDVTPLGHVRRVEEESDVVDALVNVPRALERAGEGLHSVKKIVAAMKELAHPDQGSKSGVDVNGLVETALVISKHEYKTIAAVQTVYSSVPHVPAYKTELCQVLINLIVNAAHAIESAKAVDHRAGVIRVETEALEGRVCIRVRDNGCGIPDTARDRIFDPFFTTKAVGKGTGQGLAIARATIVEKHGGELKVESTLNVGTTFTVELPVE